MLRQRLGIELEYNSISSDKLEENKLPSGIMEAACVLKETINKTIFVSNWHTTTGNDYWVVKPDSSCGFEVCSPILKSKNDLFELKEIIKSLRKNGSFSSDKRCSFHVHFELNDTSNNFLSNMIISWIKLEIFLYLLLPNYRKQTNYAQILSLSPLFFHNSNRLESFKLNQETIINHIKEYKFYSINLYHFKKSNRNTVEFRIMDSSACLNEEYAFSWISLLNNFMISCKDVNYFEDSTLNLDCLRWFNIDEAFKFLKIKKNSKIFNFCKSRFYNYSLDTIDLKMSVFKNIFESYIKYSRNYFEN